ncbi:MAG TPA: 50S ribosomal protein L11 methyltransferase [Lentisphaeria bacterium]|nr:50S ribosomal protein L11 methyltransferase [Lentisphaeria bacterium]
MKLLHVVVITSPGIDVPVLEEALAATGLTPSSYTSRETGLGTTYLIADGPENVEALRQAAEDALTGWDELLQGKPAISCQTMQQEDWSESWKKHFHTFRASERLVVKPSWETYEAQAGDVILSLDPGMCFGTGYHGTTKACLQFIDELERKQGPVSFLDAGCGSGILSLGARLLGYSPVVAFDNDPQAVDTARENLARAGVHDVVLEYGALGEFKPAQPARLVAANILAVVLNALAEDVIQLVDQSGEGGHLILSGILNEQYQEVLERFQNLGAREVSRRTIDEWTSGLFAVGPNYE